MELFKRKVNYNDIIDKMSNTSNVEECVDLYNDLYLDTMKKMVALSEKELSKRNVERIPQIDRLKRDIVILTLLESRPSTLDEFNKACKVSCNIFTYMQKGYCADIFQDYNEFYSDETLVEVADVILNTLDNIEPFMEGYRRMVSVI